MYNFSVHVFISEWWHPWWQDDGKIQGKWWQTFLIPVLIMENVNKDWWHLWWQNDSKLQGKWWQKVGYMP